MAVFTSRTPRELAERIRDIARRERRIANQQIMHADLPDHIKTITTAAALRVDKDALVGKLHRLWQWALKSHRDGFIPLVET